MKISNPFRLLAELERKPQLLKTDQITQHLSDKDRKLLRDIGLSAGQLWEKMHADTAVNYDRFRFYMEVTKAVEHWMVGPALELYADYATNYNQLHGSSVWVTSESPTYQRILSKLLDDIGIEEKIFDWAWTTGAYGDLFVKIFGVPTLGVVSVDDDEHPMNTSRVDHNGCLIGFYKTPQGQAADTTDLIPPWEYVHFRLLGAKRKRPTFSDPTYSEFRSMNLMMGADNKQVSSKYGTSLLVNSLASYKRLRLAEDSLLMARLTRGIIRYIWKMKVDSSNMESVNEMMNQLVGMLKKARALDTSSTSPNFDSKFGPLSSVEDLLIPVWGDTGDLTYDKIGGDADIRWIVDVQELRNQLACTLRVPLSVLGGFIQESSGELGSQAIEKLSIEFAHSSRRLQRAIKYGIKRICQIHLSYMNMDPDPRLFDICMSETSTAEEESIRDSLDKGCDVIQKMVDMAENADPAVDKVELVNFLNQKIMKLEDFDLNDFIKPGTKLPIEPGAEEPIEPVPESVGRKKNEEEYTPTYNTDLVSFLPIDEGAKFGSALNERWMSDWKRLYGEAKVTETAVKLSE